MSEEPVSIWGLPTGWYAFIFGQGLWHLLTCGAFAACTIALGFLVCRREFPGRREWCWTLLRVQGVLILMWPLNGLHGTVGFGLALPAIFAGLFLPPLVICTVYMAVAVPLVAWRLGEAPPVCGLTRASIVASVLQVALFCVATLVGLTWPAVDLQAAGLSAGVLSLEEFSSAVFGSGFLAILLCALWIGLGAAVVGLLVDGRKAGQLALVQALLRVQAIASLLLALIIPMSAFACACFFRQTRAHFTMQVRLVFLLACGAIVYFALMQALAHWRLADTGPKARLRRPTWQDTGDMLALIAGILAVSLFLSGVLLVLWHR